MISEQLTVNRGGKLSCRTETEREPEGWKSFLKVPPPSHATLQECSRHQHFQQSRASSLGIKTSSRILERAGLQTSCPYHNAKVITTG